MPDLLTHALLAYSLCTVLSWRYVWISPSYVTVGMVGAFIPDLAKVNMIVSSTRMAALLEMPFDWFGFHTLGGALLASLIGVVLVPPTERRRVFLLLTLGAGTHLLADGLLRWATGHSYAMFWPISTYALSTPGVYASADLWPSVLTGLFATIIWYLNRKKESKTETPQRRPS